MFWYKNLENNSIPAAHTALSRCFRCRFKWSFLQPVWMIPPFLWFFSGSLSSCPGPTPRAAHAANQSHEFGAELRLTAAWPAVTRLKSQQNLTHLVNMCSPACRDTHLCDVRASYQLCWWHHITPLALYCVKTSQETFMWGLGLGSLANLFDFNRQFYYSVCYSYETVTIVLLQIFIVWSLSPDCFCYIFYYFCQL